MKSTKLNERDGSLPSITAQEAVQLLQSAIGYLQLAGMVVQAQNTLEGLQLTIPGACYLVNADSTVAAFRIGTPPPAANDPTSPMPRSRL